MRPPYGRRRPATLRTLRERRLRAGDLVDHLLRLAPHRDERKIARRAAKASEGDVILLHDGANDRADGRSLALGRGDRGHAAQVRRPRAMSSSPIPELVAAA